MDKNFYISNTDLAKFNSFLQGESSAQTYYEVNDYFPKISELFPEQTFYHFIFKRNPIGEVGHWCLLIKFSEELYEFFDCLGEESPIVIENRLREHAQTYGINIILRETTKPLMDKDGIICGKWCILRALSLPNSLKSFIDFFKKFKEKPDNLVKFLINIPFGIIPDDQE